MTGIQFAQYCNMPGLGLGLGLVILSDVECLTNGTRTRTYHYIKVQK